MKKNSPGCGITDCCDNRPCCSGVFDIVRAGYTTFTSTFTGVDTLMLSPSPYVTVRTLAETYTDGGVTYYYCSDGGGGSEIRNGNGQRDIYAPADPRRTNVNVSLNPSTGQDIVVYSNGGAIVQAYCVGSDEYIRANVYVEYCAKYPTTSPVSDITSAGYTLDPTWAGSGDRYKKIDGDITHYVTQKISGSDEWIIFSEYNKIATNPTDMSAFPATIDVVPAWNPFSMGMKLEMT